MGLIGGLGSALAAKSQNEKAIAAANAEYAEKRNFLDNWFNKQYYSDITKRTDVQNMMKLLDENQQKQARRDEAVAAISGATTESQLAAQDSRNKSYADALAEIASNANQLKDTYLQQYQANRMSLTNPEIALRANLANQWSQASSNLFSSGASMVGSGTDAIIKGK